MPSQNKFVYEKEKLKQNLRLIFLCNKGVFWVSAYLAAFFCEFERNFLAFQFCGSG